MKNSEIRIGNWIRYKSIPFQVQSINEQFVSLLDNLHLSVGNYQIERNLMIVNPEILTKEWLNRFGIQVYNRFSEDYKKYVDEETNRVIYLKLKNVGDNPEWSFEFYENRDCFKKRIKYVHELQNLWIDITDKELEVTQIELK